nr:MAG TPA: envelope glycoprotein [Caudoviricetes sp.]DAY02493.1 MAG TPA: envelope glycoprotein [Caudoviricetes sp.]
MNKNAPSPMPNDWLFLLLVALGAVCFSVVLTLLASCTTTRIVERHTTHTDTLRVVQRDTLRELRTVRDSVYLRDSIYLEGSTLVKERTRDRWHIRRDTIWRSRVDTLRAATHAAESHKEKKTTAPWWYDWRLWTFLGIVTSFLVLLMCCGDKEKSVPL